MGAFHDADRVYLDRAEMAQDGGRSLDAAGLGLEEAARGDGDACRRALEITPPELASDIVDRGIVMTGGGALIRGLDQLLAHETNLPIHVDEEPLTCVVRGTGRILDDEEKYWSVLTT